MGNLYPLYREPGRHVAALAAEGRGGFVGASGLTGVPDYVVLLARVIGGDKG